MEEIKVNDFVRTKQGYIAKCVEVDEDVEFVVLVSSEEPEKAIHTTITTITQNHHFL